MTTRKPWEGYENTAVVSLYFRMLDAAVAGQPYNKAAMIREAQTADEITPSGGRKDAPLIARSRGSIEAKLMNCTAAHRDLRPGHETMDGHGYRALANYQSALRDEMRAALRQRDIDADAWMFPGDEEGIA